MFRSGHETSYVASVMLNVGYADARRLSFLSVLCVHFRHILVRFQRPCRCSKRISTTGSHRGQRCAVQLTLTKVTNKMAELHPHATTYLMSLSVKVYSHDLLLRRRVCFCLKLMLELGSELWPLHRPLVDALPTYQRKARMGRCGQWVVGPQLHFHTCLHLYLDCFSQSLSGLCRSCRTFIHLCCPAPRCSVFSSSGCFIFRLLCEIVFFFCASTSTNK